MMKLLVAACLGPVGRRLQLGPGVRVGMAEVLRQDLLRAERGHGRALHHPRRGPGQDAPADRHHEGPVSRRQPRRPRPGCASTCRRRPTTSAPTAPRAAPNSSSRSMPGESRFLLAEPKTPGNAQLRETLAGRRGANWSARANAGRQHVPDPSRKRSRPPDERPGGRSDRLAVDAAPSRAGRTWRCPCRRRCRGWRGPSWRRASASRRAASSARARPRRRSDGRARSRRR